MCFQPANRLNQRGLVKPGVGLGQESGAFSHVRRLSVVLTPVTFVLTHAVAASGGLDRPEGRTEGWLSGRNTHHIYLESPDLTSTSYLHKPHRTLHIIITLKDKLTFVP